MIKKYNSNFRLARKDNCLSFEGKFTALEVRIVFAILHDCINSLKYKDLTLDFSRCTSVSSASMLPICSYAMLSCSNRIDFDIILPESEHLKSKFINTAWAHFICPRKYNYPNINQFNKNLPAFKYTTHEEQSEILDQILEKLLSIIPNFSREAFAAVEWALNEITDNVNNHSQSAVGGLLQLTTFEENRNKIEFTVSDAGKGVAKTLRDAKPEIKNDADALLEAVKSGITRNSNEFQGNGLYGTFEICRVGDGRFTLNSGKAALIWANGGVTLKTETIPFTGSCIDALIDYSQPQLLEKAISINGKIHKPTDYIELKYEKDNLKTIDFKLSNHAKSVRSRPAGKPVMIKLQNIISSCPGQKIIVDFENIAVISSSFADEVFGKLFLYLGPMQFLNRISIVNASSTINALIDRAITQRLQSNSKAQTTSSMQA